MTIEIHPAVQGDFNQALDYYEAEGGLHLADRFEGEFRACVAAIEKAPFEHQLNLAHVSFGSARIALRGSYVDRLRETYEIDKLRPVTALYVLVVSRLSPKSCAGGARKVI